MSLDHSKGKFPRIQHCLSKLGFLDNHYINETGDTCIIFYDKLGRKYDVVVDKIGGSYVFISFYLEDELVETNPMMYKEILSRNSEILHACYERGNEKKSEFKDIRVKGVISHEEFDCTNLLMTITDIQTLMDNQYDDLLRLSEFL